MNKFIDTCRLFGNYNDKDVYLYSSAKYDRPRLFFISNYYYWPKWVADHEKLTLIQAIKIINYRMRNQYSDTMPEDLKIDTLIQKYMYIYYRNNIDMEDNIKKTSRISKKVLL